jgi:hypothetical protein
LFSGLGERRASCKDFGSGDRPGKVNHRVLLADGERGLIGEPVSLPTQREGVERLCALIASAAAPETVIAIEATGSLHVPWATELERRLPGSLRLFANIVAILIIPL